MGRRINISTPTVINTELVPLDESFYLEVDGQMEQWYYDNTEQYAPNRKVTPLLLTPVISTFDKDTSTSYTPAFNTIQWFANEWNEAQGKYVETEITNQVDSGSADYVIQGHNLLVKKNVSYSHAVSIRCVTTYIDPRDSGVTYAVEDSVNLTTNRTADTVFPEVDIISPSGRSYNPLVDDTNSQYDFKGVTTNNPVQPLNTDVRRYPVDVDGTEEILNSGDAVAPIMNIRYGENPTMTDQEFMYRPTADGELVGESIDKAYIERIKGNTVEWNQLATDGASEYRYDKDSTRTRSLMFNNNLPSEHKILFFYLVKDAVASTSGNNTFGIEYGVGEQVFNPITNGISANIVTLQQERNNVYTFIHPGCSSGTAFTMQNFMTFDLTLIYGEGNEPSTVEQFKADYFKWFGKPLSYEEYDAGSLRPVLMQSVKTTGFNQWDEQWRNGFYDSTTGEYRNIGGGYILCNTNPIKVLEGEYYIKNVRSLPCWVGGYKSDGTFIGAINVTDQVFVVTSECAYINFYIGSYGTTYEHDICINISNPAKNGTYEPYEEKVQGLDVTALKGKLNGAGESVTIFSDGLKKAVDVQDEIFVEDGVVKAVKRIGAVDLGSLDWRVNNPEASLYCMRPITSVSNMKSPTTASEIPNIVCGLYIANEFATTVNNGKDKVVGIRVDEGVPEVNDRNYTDPSTFKAAMNGVMLYYELAEPQTYVLDPITDFVWYGIKNGQEVLADTLPWYVSGQNTDSLVVDAMYGENINVVLRCKMMDGETLSPSKAYATLSWRTPDIETFIQSDNGGAVRSDTDEMTFGTIVNVNGWVLSDELKQKHLAFNWKIRKNNTSTEVDKGWGQRITIDASELRNVRGSGSTLASTLVNNEVYLKGAYEEVTDNNQAITDGGEAVYDRPVD